MKIWIVTGSTESGDNIVPLAFDIEPTKEKVEEILKKKYPDEYLCHGTIYFSIDEGFL